VARFEGKTVLIVDDEFAVVESLTEILAWEGFAVLTAANGAEGLRILDSERPDWIVVDLMMRAMNGTELCKRVRALEWATKLPIVLMSAAVAPQARDGTACWNVYLRKPFKVADLLRALEDAQRDSQARN
jgi:two-component system response regulator MprA